MTKARVWAFCATSLLLLAAGIALDPPAGPLLLTGAVIVATIGVVLTGYDNLRRRR